MSLSQQQSLKDACILVSELHKAGMHKKAHELEVEITAKKKEWFGVVE